MAEKGVKIYELPQDNIIDGNEKVLISDNGTSKFATVNQLFSVLSSSSNTQFVDSVSYIINTQNVEIVSKLDNIADLLVKEIELNKAQQEQIDNVEEATLNVEDVWDTF